MEWVIYRHNIWKDEKTKTRQNDKKDAKLKDVKKKKKMIETMVMKNKK